MAASSGLAAAAFEEAHISFSSFDMSIEVMPGRAAQLLDAMKPGAVLAGTSAGVTFEKMLIETAKRRGIPTIGVLDHWSNYLLRFQGPGGSGHYFPSILAVMDDAARADLLAEGYAYDAIVVTGQPAFDALVALDERQRPAIRETFGVRADERLLVFASEPLRRDHGRSLGFDETDALRMLLEVVGTLPGAAPRVLIKPHPTEPIEALSAVAARSPVQTAVVPDAVPRDLVLAADVVVGMTSVILLESALLGTPVVSLQPNLRTADQFIGTRLGIVRPAYDSAACRSALVELLGASDRRGVASAARSILRVDGGASGRVADLIETALRPGAARTVHSQVP
jgi:CDP-Glycerol:Poly(glycerophosphate) glycerophosphotransferase